MEEGGKIEMPAKSVAVVGLGYVGLPLAVAFGAKIRTVGFDIDHEKIEAYRRGGDPTGEVLPRQFQQAEQIEFTNDPRLLGQVEMIIVAVPTPINKAKLPDLDHLVSASRLVGENMMKGVTVVYESTVYPGVTEEVCVPVLEEASGMSCGKDFKVAYSPERINPGDREHTLDRIVKVVAAQDPQSLEMVASTYELVVPAGIYRAKGIKVAEAAKVLENTQRDLNIALMNELAVICDRLGIDTKSVIETAATKWNFIPFTPGLVGGHCIGVDPYYLTFCAQQQGYFPQVILAGRRINDSMGRYVAQRTVKELVHLGIKVNCAKVAILGLTFKENCPDIRNTRVVDIVSELNEYGISPTVHDPLASVDLAKRLYGVDAQHDYPSQVDAVILAVGHDAYRQEGPGLLKGLLKRSGGVIIDVKGLFEPEEFPEHNYRYWRL